jgi:endo-1,4-beta-D-glucanase Y
MKPNLTKTTVLLLASAALLNAEPPARAYPQHVAYAEGSIRPNHRTQQQLDDDVRTFYARWKSEFIKPEGISPDGRQRYRVAFGKKPKAGERTVSEGQGYGMVIVALMAGEDAEAQMLFDGLHDFALDHPSSRDARLMTWEVPIRKGGDSAFDGDADIAHALLLAHAQWGSAGKTDYAKAARIRLAGILASTIGPRSRLPMLGDWVQAEGDKKNEYTPRTSDFMPAHFKSWARFTNDPAWLNVAENCSALLETIQHDFSQNTGLIPEFVIDAKTAPKPASGKFLEGATDGDYYYNAGRTPWRLAVDALLNADRTSLNQARRISRWAMKATAGDPQKLRSGYRLDGTPLADSDYFSTFFAAPIGVAAMLDSENPAWLNALYDSVRTKHEDYYEDSVALQCLLVMSGNYWDPAPAVIVPDGRLQPRACP